MMVIGQIKPVNGALCDRQQESRRRMVNAEMAGISASYNTHARTRAVHVVHAHTLPSRVLRWNVDWRHLPLCSAVLVVVTDGCLRGCITYSDEPI